MISTDDHVETASTSGDAPLTSAAGATEEWDDKPFGTSGLLPAAMFGVLALGAPFVLRFPKSSSSSINGQIVSASYFEPVAVAAGVLALLVGLYVVFQVLRKRARGVANVLAGVAAVAGGAYHLVDGLGVTRAVSAPVAADIFSEAPAAAASASATGTAAVGERAAKVTHRLLITDNDGNTHDPLDQSLAATLKRCLAFGGSDCDDACEKGSGEACFDAAAVAYDAKKYDVQRARSKRGCELGYGGACGNLGAVYHAGIGVPVDKAEAGKWFRQACKLGEQNRCGIGLASMGTAFDKQDADEFVASCKDGKLSCADAAWSAIAVGGPEVGVYVLETLCARDDARACRLRAVHAYQTEDRSRYIQDVERACEVGDAFSCGNAGAAYVEGTMTAKDDAKAGHWFRRACQLGELTRCAPGLSRLPADAPIEGMAKLVDRCRAKDASVSCADISLPIERSGNTRVSNVLIDEMCGRGDGAACSHLAQATEDYAKKVALYQRGCAGGDGESCINATSVGFAGKLIDRAQLKRDFGKLCAGDRAEDCYKMSQRIGAQPNKYELARAACEQGWALACDAAGLYLHKGKATDGEDSKALARQFWQRGCDVGTFWSCNNLGVVRSIAGESDDKVYSALAVACEAPGMNHPCLDVATLAVLKDRPKLAARLLRKGCGEIRESASCYELAVRMKDEPAGLAEAVEAVTKACNDGGSSSCGALGRLHLEGIHPESDPAAGELQLGLACEADDGLACGFLATATAAGKFGIKADAAAAQKHAANACRLGQKHHCASAASR